MYEILIFYVDEVVSVFDEAAWKGAPDEGVQVVVRMRPDLVGVSLEKLPLQARRWYGNKGDRELWTGEDVYDPFGWGEKFGSLISDNLYFSIWEEALTWPL